MRPLVAEHLDGLRLAHFLVQKDHEPLIASKALAQHRFGEPRSPNDDGEGWRTVSPKARQNHLKFSPASAVRETAARGRHRLGVPSPNPRQGTAMAAENGHVIATV
jgi:hypothetical protein